MLCKKVKLKIGNFESFSPDECKGPVIGYQSGGRLIEYKDNNLLMTIEIFKILPLRKIKIVFGKIISINITDKKHRLISMGHRNPKFVI